MKKIKSTKAFKDAVDVAFDTQTKRDRKKREYDEQRKAFDERHDALCEYALGHPEVFDPGEDGRSREGSTDRVKYKLTSGETLERIDGGSISGGDPLMQWDFVSQVIDRLEGIHTAVETSGYTSDAVFAQVLDRLDLVMMDWKVSDPARHRHYTGVDQAPIRRHAQMLAAGDTPFILRMPMIPGVNDERAHFETVAGLVRGARALVRVDILPYQRAAGAKYEMVGKAYAPEFDESVAPRYFLDVFDAAGIPYQVFR